MSDKKDDDAKPEPKFPYEVLNPYTGIYDKETSKTDYGKRKRK